MNLHNQTVGAIGEKLALNFLKKSRYAIVKKNYRSRYGEIDIIAKKNDNVTFIEVKCRTSLKAGFPYEAVTRIKLKHLQLAAKRFLLNSEYKNCKLSLGVISILLKPDLSLESLKFYDEF